MRLILCFNAVHPYSLLSIPCSLFPVPCSLKTRNFYLTSRRISISID
ncbi:hypothetical protein [Moorena producens]